MARTFKPDIAGYRAAQERKRGFFGVEVTFFYGVTGEVWPEGTLLDPETSRPIDWTVEPVSSGAQASGSIPVGVAYRSSQDPSDPAAIGWVEQAEVMLIANLDDAPVASGAATFLLRDERYQVVANGFDGIAAESDRYLVWGRRG